NPWIGLAGREFKSGGIALQHLQILATPIEHSRDDVRDEILGELHVFVEREICDLGLDHPELGQMAPGLGLLGAEGGAEAIDLAEGERASHGIELSALREIRLAFAKIVDLE